MKKDRLDKQLEFILAIDKEKNIFRQTYVSDASRMENDAEHAWHMAVMCMILSEYAEHPIDKLKTMTMLLIHDLVEIYAGDTYAYAGGGCRRDTPEGIRSSRKVIWYASRGAGNLFHESVEGI